METRYHIISTKSELNELISSIEYTKKACIDFETNGEKIYQKAFLPTILSVSFQPGSACIIPLAHQDSPLKESWLYMLQYFGKAVIENPEITKLGWNWKFDNQIFKKYDIHCRGTVIDGMLAKYILNEERPNGLKEMVERYLPEYAGYEESPDFKKSDWGNKPFLPLCQYASIDTDMTFRLCTFFEKKLIDLGFYKLYRNLIMPASEVLQSTEIQGLFIDKDLNKKLQIKYKDLIQKAYTKLAEIPRVKRFIKILQKEKINKYIKSLEDEINELKGSDKPNALRLIESRENKILNVTAGNYSNKTERALVEPFNFGSTKQLNDLLFLHPKGLNYPIVAYTFDKKTKKSTDKPSTAEDALLKLVEYDEFGVVNALLELRGLEHTMSGFILGYESHIQDDGKIHPRFNIMGTVSGRLSSSDINAQQIPKMEVNKDVKPQLIAPSGSLYLMLDYSAAELRVMAHLAKSKALLEAFNKGQDVHLAMACKKWHLNYDDILPIYQDETHPDYKLWKVRRKQVKQVVFGTIYGIQAKKLSEQLSDVKSGMIVTPDEAQIFLDEFFDENPEIKKFVKKSYRQMEKDGSVFSLFGRKRRCPDIFGDNYGKYLEAQRTSVNFKTQSAASDMTLFSSVLIYWLIKKGLMPPIKQCSTVHDALYYLSNPAFLNPWTIYQIHNICKNPETKKYFGFTINDISMVVDFGVGRHMGEELPFCPGYDYRKLLKPDFNLDEYYKQHALVKHISVDEYPKAFPEYFTKSFIHKFTNKWIRLNNKDL